MPRIWKILDVMPRLPTMLMWMNRGTKGEKQKNHSFNTRQFLDSSHTKAIAKAKDVAGCSCSCVHSGSHPKCSSGTPLIHLSRPRPYDILAFWHVKNKSELFLQG
jgi:hypothetical protein